MRPTTDQHPSHTDLAAFALGKLDRSAVEWVGGHLADCSTCRDMVEQTPTDTLVKLLKEAGAGRVPAVGKTGPWISGTDTHSSISPPVPAIDPDEIPPALRDHPRYRILRKLGEGGMGVVYQAEHKMMGRLVAVKVMNRGFVGHPEAIDRFNREIKAVGALNHPNIAQAYDADQADDLQLLVMEFVEGQDLGAYSKAKGPLPVAHACYYIRQAALGLQHAHEHGLVHRDLKPQNLMRMPKGNVKILDFGLAKLLTEPSAGHGLTRDKTTMGTPAYIAPEQALDTKSADIRADIYSLGCTLFCLLTGRPPFVGDNETELVIAHLQNAPPALESLRPDAPPELAALVARMLAKKPDDRPQTPKEVAEALGPFVKGLAKASPAASSPALPRPTMRRRQWLIPAAVAVALFIAGIGLWAGGVFKVKTKDGMIVLENLPADADVTVDGEKVMLTTGPGNTVQISVASGKKHRLQVKNRGFMTIGEEVELAAGGTQTITVRLEADGDGPVGPKGQVLAVVPEKSEWAGTGTAVVNGKQGLLVAALTVTKRQGAEFKASVRINGDRLMVDGTVNESGVMTYKVSQVIARSSPQENVTGTGKAGQGEMTLVLNNPDTGGTRNVVLKQLSGGGASFRLEGRWNCFYPKNTSVRTVTQDGSWLNETNQNKGKLTREGGFIDVVVYNGDHEWYVIDPENPNVINGIAGVGTGKPVPVRWVRQ